MNRLIVYLFIGIIIILSGLYYMNWAINQDVKRSRPHDCPIWLADTPQAGCPQRENSGSLQSNQP